MVEIASFPAPSTEPKSRLTRLARIGVWVSTAALVIAFAALGYTIYAAAIGHPQLVSELLVDFGLDGHLESLTTAQRWTMTVLWMLVDLLGIAMIWSIRKLFLTARRGDIFSISAARRLRQIGWIILAMAPVSTLAVLIGGVSVSYLALDGEVHGQVSIDDADIYAIIIGLVLVAVGHMMTLASNIDAENREFI